MIDFKKWGYPFVSITNKALILPILIFSSYTISVIPFGKLAAQAPATYTLSPIALFDGITYVHIFFSENNKDGWVCGARGVILVTHDGGKTWKDISPVKDVYESSTVHLDKIIFKPDNKTGFVIGGMGTIFRTLDGGQHWQRIILKTESDLTDIHFSFDNKIVRVLNDDAEVFESADDGATWGSTIDLKYQTPAFVATNNSFLVFEKKLGTGIYEYISNGDSSKDISVGAELAVNYSYIKSIKYDYSSNKYLGLHDNGYLMSYNTNGKWESIGRVPDLTTPYDFCFDKSGKKIFVIGDYSKLYKSNDGGITWQQLLDLNNDGFDFYSISCSKNGEDIWICGTNRTLVHSNDSGNSWEYKTGDYFKDSFFTLEKSNFSINAGISETFYNEKNHVLYSACDKGIISTINLKNFKSERLTPTYITCKLTSIKYNSFNDALFAVGDTLTIIKYSLATRKCEIVFKQAKSRIQLNSICFSENQKIGIAVGDESTILVSKDAGNSWKQSSKAVEDFLKFSATTVKNNTFYVLGNKGKLYTANIDVEKWKKQTVGDSTESLTSIDFSATSNIGFITSSDSRCRKHLYKTDDLGNTWREVNNLPNYNSRNLQCVRFNKHTNEIYVTDSYGGIYKSIDNGNNWFKIFPWQTYNALKYISFDNNNNPIFSGDNGTLIICVNKDHKPNIIKFDISQSILGGLWKPSIKITDQERNDKLVYSLSVVDNLATGADKSFKNQLVYIKNNDILHDFPNEIFVQGVTYTFRLTVFDGWNIISKDIKIRIGKSRLQRFAEYMYWSPLPNNEEILKSVTRNLTLLAILYAIVVLVLYLFSPRNFILWHEAVSNSRLPFPEKISKFLVLFLIESDRCLNAFVTMYRDRAMELINNYEEVKSRSIWVNAPFKLDNIDIVGFQQGENKNKYYVPGLAEIQRALRKNRIIIRIEGQGGIGKTSLALQLYKWATETDKTRRLQPWTCLPIYIDKLGDKTLDEICTSKLQYLSNSSSISNTLSEALLRKKRVVVVVDGISEMLAITEKQYLPEFGAKNNFLVIYTSRKPVQIPESTVVYPMGLKIDFLDMLLDSFTNSYAEAYKFGSQREPLRQRVKTMLTELNSDDVTKPVPLSMLKEIVKQASILIDENKPLAEFLPRSIGELYDRYIFDLFRNTTNKDELIENLRDVSLISIGLSELLDSTFSITKQIEVKPMWLPKTSYTKFISKDKVDILLLSGALNSTNEAGVIYIKFMHDPVGEYLASVKIMILYKLGTISKEQIDFISKSTTSTSFLSLLKSTASRMRLDILL
ncbi:YCF48-related protein [Chitinophagaceae bacterium 26-R-25]|nr:YCF48-related protein [Chitinophagaceae bacterium 26-R-25]